MTVDDTVDDAYVADFYIVPVEDLVPWGKVLV